MLDRAFLLARRSGLRFALRCWAGGALFAGACLGLYYVERVEGIRGMRPGLSVLLVLAWLGRALLLSEAARVATRELSERIEIPEDAGGIVDVVRVAALVGFGVWIWSWPLLGAALVGPALLALTWPLLGLRGAVAPSWIARAGCVPGGGLRAFRRAVADTEGRRLTTAAAELAICVGALALFANLYGVLLLAVLLGRSTLGLDLALLDSFVSFDNTLVVLSVLALSLVALEPLRVAWSALVFVDAGVRQQGLHLRALVDRALRVEPRSRGRGARAAAVGLALGAGLAGGAAHAQPDWGDPDAPGWVEGLELGSEQLAPDDAWPSPLTEPDDLATRDRVREILAAREFAEHDGAGGTTLRLALTRLLDRLLRDVDLSAGDPSGPRLPMPPGWVFLLLAAALLVAVAAYLLAARARDRRAAARAGGAGPAAGLDPREQDPSAHLDEAALLARDGRHRDALRALYLATLVALDRRRLIDFDPALTNWQYIRQMSRGEPARARFVEFTRLFDHKWYGDEPTTEPDYVRGRELADRICRPEVAG